MEKIKLLKDLEKEEGIRVIKSDKNHLSLEWVGRNLDSFSFLEPLYRGYDQ